MKTALIVIDMQQACLATPRHDADGLMARINALAEKVRAAGGIVIFIQHEGPSGDAFERGASGWKLHPAMRVEAKDLRVAKTSCDAFLNTSLQAELEAQGVKRLLVTGCATDYCVDTTVRSALGRSWPTIVPSDGHTTADRPHLTAEKIIAHHNAVWADFIAPAGPAQIRSCADVNI